MGSWATARDGGFSDSDIAALLRIQNNLALAARMAVLSRLAGNMLATYLGGGAGTRVLSGQIKRGDGETIRAALVMADMRRSTELAERSGRQEFIAILNDFFDAMAGPFAEAGGEILSFVGDGFLAVFPCPRQKTPTEIACRSALASARVAVARMAAFNAPRRQRCTASDDRSAQSTTEFRSHFFKLLPAAIAEKMWWLCVFDRRLDHGDVV